MSQTKANDVIELGRARALLGCSSTMSLLDGVRAIKANLADAYLRIEQLEKNNASSSSVHVTGSDRTQEEARAGSGPQEP